MSASDNDKDNNGTHYTNYNSDKNNEKVQAAAVQVEGGTLKDRLKLLEEQRQRDEAKNKATPTKQSIKIEGGNLQDRLQQLEKTRQSEAAKLAAARNSHITDPALVTDDLIRERMAWMSKLQEAEKIEKEAIIIEGGGLKDRLALLEQTRERDAARLASKTTDLAQVSDDLIRERLKFMDDLVAKSQAGGGGTSKAAIVVQGGNLQERLRLLEEQRRRTATRAAGQTADFSHVSDELIREKLKQLEDGDQTDAAEIATTAERREAATIIKGGSLNVRKMLLREQTRREQERLAVRRMVDVESKETVKNRMAWLQKQTALDDNKNKHTPSKTVQSFISSDLIAEKINWLRESAEKAAQLPEKEREERTNQLVEERKQWLTEQMESAAKLPPQERIQVSQGLIRERMQWLQDNLQKTESMTHKERTQMTTDLIAERIYLLEAQIAAHTANSEAQASLQQQIDFLEEQQTGDMTEEEVAPLLQVLMTEKISDLEQQEQLVAEVDEEQQVQVTQALLEDRQAWLEGDSNHYQRKRDDHKRAQEIVEASSEVESVIQKQMAEEIANSIAFWEAQKEGAAELSPPERAQITAFLIAEHLVSLEVQLGDDSVDAETKASVEQQISFLNDQMENIDEVDHLMMINILVQEKIDGLQSMNYIPEQHETANFTSTFC